jgi:hypothetical protein
MKKLFAFLFICASVTAQAPSFYKIAMIWNNNVEPDLVGYRMYQNVPPSTNWVQVAQIMTNTVTITNTTAQLQKFRVTAYNQWLESLPSNELTVNTISPSAPGSFRLQSIQMTLVP